MTAPGVRVLHAVPDLLYGGLQRLVVQLVGRLDPARFQPGILVFGAMGPLSTAVPSTVPVLRVGPQSRLSMVNPKRVQALIRDFGPDVLHSHSGVWYKASLAANRAGVCRIVHTDHGRAIPDPWSARLVDSLASRRTDMVIAVSDSLAAYLRRRVVVHSCPIRVITNGVDTDLIRPGSACDLRRELGLSPDVIVLGSVGRLEPVKGFDVMIDAYATLHALGAAAGTVLLIVGDGSERSRLEAHVRSLGLGATVRFVGWRQDVSAVLATFDLFVLTSRSEGTSVGLLEAMSAGLCPVVTRVGGNPAVLGDSLAHRLVPSEDPASIALGWRGALLDGVRRREDGRTARRRVADQFSLTAMLRGYEAVYEGRPAPVDLPISSM